MSVSCSSSIGMCNEVQIVDGRGDDCGNWDGNVGIDGGNVRRIGQDVGLFSAFLNGHPVILMPACISKLHCLKLLDLVNI